MVFLLINNGELFNDNYAEIEDVLDSYNIDYEWGDGDRLLIEEDDYERVSMFLENLGYEVEELDRFSDRW